MPGRRSEPFRLHIAQIAPALGDLERNCDLHLERIAAARADGAHLVVFPELSLTGYWLHDMVTELAAELATSPVLARLREASRELDVVAGLVEAGEDGQVYNTAVWLSGGRVLHRHRKIYLPTYTLFDEGRYFTPGDEVRAFAAPFGRAGMLICEDLWHPALPYVLDRDGCDLLVVPSSSPARGVSGPEPDSQRAWKLLGETTARFHTQFVVYVGRVGVEDGHAFGGSSYAFGPDGCLLAELPSLDDAAVTVEMDRREIPRARSVNPLRRDDRPHLVYRELGRILADGDTVSGSTVAAAAEEPPAE